MSRRTRAVSTCNVCGDTARYAYYGAVVCLSCKMFFKRHAENLQRTLVCTMNGLCELNTLNRHTCTACRLAKCFRVGMRVELLRGSRAKPNPATALTLSSIRVVNLLDRGQSLLLPDERTHISNLINSCNNCDAMSAASGFLDELNSLHPRLRFKIELPRMIVLATAFYQAAESFVRANEDLASFPPHERSIVARNAMDNVSVLLGGFISRQSGLMGNPAYHRMLEQAYGASAYRQSLLSISLLDDDVNLMKLAFATFAFGPNDCALFESNMPRVYLPDSHAAVRLQHMYVELLWKYLLQKYSYEQTVMRFSRLVRCVCAMLMVRIDLHAVNNHTDIFLPLIEQFGEERMNGVHHG